MTQVGALYYCYDPNSYAATYRYDEGTNALGQTQKGFRTSMSDANGNSATWRYDVLGRLLVESKTIPGAPANPYLTEYAYDDLNRVVTMKYPDGEIVTAAYNLQRLPEVLTGYVTSASYAASDQMTNLTLGNGIATNYTYHAQTLRLETLQTGPTNNIQHFAYGYDNVGNVKTITQTKPDLSQEVTTFSYDDLNRLLTASIPSVYAHSWTYNPIGNMLTRNDNNGNVTYSYNDPAHKHAVTQIGSLYYCYDANGNMTKRGASNATCTTGGDTLAYDQENRLTSITVGANTTTYVYDGDGNRVKKTANGVSTYYIGNYYEVTNNVATKYYYFGKQRVAMRVGANTPLYLHSDHLGSTSITTNASGQCTSAQWYYAYGSIRTPAPTLPCSGIVPTDFGFTGQRRDASAGLMYYGARYYDSALGRFVSADTLVPDQKNPQSLNRYSYVYDNPLKYNDPSGHCPNPDLPSDYEGSVICVDLFIQSEHILQGDWRSLGGIFAGLGDNRSFDSDSDPAKSRGFLYIFLKKDGTIDHVDEPHINPSCIQNIGCFGPVLDRNSFTATQDPASKEITIKWKLLNGVSGELLNAADQSDQVADALKESPFAGFRKALGLGQRFGGSQLESIDGTLMLRLRNDGTWRPSGGARDPFPSLEVYEYKPNSVDAIYRRYEQYGPDLGPIYGLTDQAPRDTYGLGGPR